MNPNKYKIAFWGTDSVSVHVLESLKNNGIIPELIITMPDQRSGRGHKIKPSQVKIWADQNNIKTLQPEKLDENFISEINATPWDLFLVASYGKIIKQNILDIPKFGALNVHPSLLPKYRGPSPIISAILNDEKKTGVTIMKMDSEMDHGPIIKQEFFEFEEWPKNNEAEKILATIGGEMLAQIIVPWIEGKITAKEQNHTEATYTKKISKEAGLVQSENLSKRETFLKVQAFNPWPGTYFFIESKKHGVTIRVKITDAIWEENETKIQRVIPEGRKEMDFQSFLNGFLK